MIGKGEKVIGKGEKVIGKGEKVIGKGEKVIKVDCTLSPLLIIDFFNKKRINKVNLFL